MKKYLILLLFLTSCYDDYTGMILSDDQVKNYTLMRNRTHGFVKHRISITETNEYGDILLDNGYALYKVHKDKYIFEKQKIMPERVMDYSEYIKENYSGEKNVKID